MKKIIGKRALSFVLSAALLITQMGVPVFAAEVAIGANGLCEHHAEHTLECGYAEGADCTHEHTEDCYRTETLCTFIASDEDDVSENTATPSEPPEQMEHECTEESGCITKTPDCKHTHDEACGFAEPSPCTYKCEICAAMDSGDVTIGVSSITVTGFDELEEAVRQRTVPVGTELAALNLPDTLKATGYEIAEDASVVDSGTAPVTTPAAITIEGVTWELDPTNEVNNGNSTYDPAQGSYAFTPVLPEGYALTDGTTLPEIWVMVGAPLLLAGDIPYIDENGDSQTATGATEITAETETLTNGWYYVPRGSAITRGTITVNGNDVHLILVDGCDLTVTGSSDDDDAGINVSGDNAITIYGQSGGTGKLSAKGDDNDNVESGAGIGGGCYGAGGTITINGGTVAATGGRFAAGIGGGYSGAGGTIIINGGTVTATGNGGAAGIGSGYGDAGGNTTITGGTVTATGSTGIGGSVNGAGGTITINGGTVTATGNYGAGIGGGQFGAGGTITITGGTVKAMGDSGAGIGGGHFGAGGTATITGGRVTAMSQSGAGIGAGNEASGGKFSTGTDGNIFIVASSISDQSGKTDKTWRGIIFDKSAGAIYGDSVTLTSEQEIPANHILIIPPDSSKTISGTIKNAGAVYVYGTLNFTGTWSNVDDGKLFQLSDGYIEGIADDLITKTATTELNGFRVTGGLVALDYYLVNDVFTIASNTPMTIQNIDSAEPNSNNIKVADGVDANITLNGVNITVADGHALDMRKGGVCTITLEKGSLNTLKSSNQGSGIFAPERPEGSNAKLIIQGGGELNATGPEYFPGICGNGGRIIEIRGGVITSNGESSDIGVSSGQGDAIVIIKGGSVKTGKVPSQSIISPPVNGENTRVYLGKLADQSGVTAVSVDGTPYYIAQNHTGDNTLYFYMTGKNHSVQVKKSDGKVYTHTATYVSGGVSGNEGNGFFTFTPDGGGGTTPATNTNVAFDKPDGYEAPYTTPAVEVKLTISEVTSKKASARSAAMDELALALTDSSGAQQWLGRVAVRSDQSEYAFNMPTSNLELGAYTLTAEYGGSSTNLPSNAVIATLTIQQAEPTISVTADEIDYGQTLSQSGLSKSTATNAAGDNVAGTFSWQSDADSIIPAVSASGTTQYSVTFTPADTVRYSVASKNDITLTVNKLNLTPSITVIGVSKIYDGNTNVVGTQPILSLTGQLSGETPVATATYQYASKNVGANAYILASVTLTDAAVNDNYELTTSEVYQVGAAIIAADQAAPSVTAVAETFVGERDGKITGTTTAMEYSTTSTFNTTTACGGTEITGLAPGTYYVRYKAKDNYNAGAAATVTIAAGATRTYTLTVSEPTFTAATYGYSQPAAQEITITSTGNSNATISTVTVSGDAFVIGGIGNSVTAGGSINTWTVQPKAGLDAGTHTATITVTYNNNMAATASVSFTVNNASQTAPSAPTQPSVGTATTHNSITINTASGQKYICTTSSTTPAISGGAGWTTGTGSANTFNGLTRNTNYYIWAYTAGDANHNDSAVSTALSVKTPEEPIASVNVLEITAPASKATPDTSAANGTGWTAGTVSWFMGATPLNGNFDYEKVYTAKVTLTAAEGYKFPDTVTAQVGGNGATVTDKSASSITVSYTYPTTGAQGQTAAPGFANANYAMPTAATTAATFALTGDTTNTTYKLYDQQAGGSEASTDVSMSVSGSTLTLTFTTVPNADKTYYVSATKGQDKESTRTAITVKTYVATTGISLNKDALSLTKGGSETLTATITPNTATNKMATWTSSDSNIATVDASGKVTAISAGTATITTKAADGQTAICTVTVTVPPSPPSGGGDTGGGSSNTITEPKPAEKYTVQNGALALDRSELQSLVNAGKSLTISDGKVTLVFDTAAIKAILDTTNGKVTFGMSAANISNFKDAKAAIGSRPVYTFTISVGGKTVPVNFGTGKVSVSIPYTPAKEESSGNLYTVYVDGNGKVEYITGSSYDQNSKAVIFNAPHFSTYGVAYKADAPQFTDITNHWAKADIEFVASRNLLTGTGKDKFSPDTGMTRGMFVTALGRLAGIDVNSYKTGKFTDVAATAYYAPYVNWAASKGITSGTTATTFSPDKTITRQELATLMANYAKAMGYTLPKTRAAVTYADNGSIGSWAAEAVKAMQMAGVMNGKDGNKFDPTGTATRAEVSAVLHRYVELVVDPATAQGLDVNDSGKIVYYENGKLFVGTKTIDGTTYHFGSDGICVRIDAVVPETKKYITHKIVYGDTLWDLSRKYKCTVAEIIGLNGIINPVAIPVGTEIKIPQK